jgi:SAM-dependent methyltransferase
MFVGLRNALRRGSRAITQSMPFIGRRAGQRLSGQFQPYNYTLPDRYPWLFEFAAGALGSHGELQILSFGCSRGDEIDALRKHFPRASIRGIDVNPQNIQECIARARASRDEKLSFAVAGSTREEPDSSFDAIFCLAVLCQGDLTATAAQRCDPLLRFADFETIVADFARCLKPKGLLLLHTANFRFCDTEVAADFDPVFQATPAQLANDVLFDRNNLLLAGVRYHDVAFRKKARIDS